MTIPIWVLYVALSVAYFLIGSALLLAIVPPLVRVYHEWRWRRFKARHGGDQLVNLERLAAAGTFKSFDKEKYRRLGIYPKDAP
jgi:uncharacterized membrane protein